MIFEVECESRVGQKSKKYTCDNQDAFSFKTNDRWCCLCVADGAGSKKHSSLGAQWLTHDVSEYLIENACALINNDEVQIREKVVSCIQHSLDKTVAIRGVNYSDLSSTLICILTDGEKCVLLHIGDGVILTERRGVLNVLSFPRNGVSKQSTALTTMDTLETHLRIRKELCEDMDIIWVMTDGAMYEVFQENYGLNGGKLTMPMIRAKLAAGHSDDATYGYIQWRNEDE